MSNEPWAPKPTTRGDSEAKAWASTRAKDFGEAVKFWRNKNQLSAVELSNRTKEIGFPITRGTIAKIESNSRNSKVDFAEVTVLAAALHVTPADLVYFGYPDGRVPLTPRTWVTAKEARDWLVGGWHYRPFAQIHNPRIELSEQLRKAINNYQEAVDAFEKRWLQGVSLDDLSQYKKIPLHADSEGEWHEMADTISLINSLEKEVAGAGGHVVSPAWMKLIEPDENGQG